MNNINLLLEKYLTGFKKYGHTVEVFENPTRSELRDVGGRFRFIADAKRQKMYIWSAMGAIHADAWLNIKKQLNDSRPLYKSSTLVPAVYENGYVHIFAAKGIPRSIAQQYEYEDWNFVNKYVPIDKLSIEMDKLK